VAGKAGSASASARSEMGELVGEGGDGEKGEKSEAGEVFSRERRRLWNSRFVREIMREQVDFSLCSMYDPTPSSVSHSFRAVSSESRECGE